MIGQLIGSLTGLATSIIDGKTQIKLTEAEIKKKQLTGEMDWEQSAIEASNNSYKDELWTIVFVLILVGNFIPALQDNMARGFANLEAIPLWVQWGMYASIAASFGIRTMRGLKKGKRILTAAWKCSCIMKVALLQMSLIPVTMVTGTAIKAAQIWASRLKSTPHSRASQRRLRLCKS